MKSLFFIITIALFSGRKSTNILHNARIFLLATQKSGLARHTISGKRPLVMAVEKSIIMRRITIVIWLWLMPAAWQGAAAQLLVSELLFQPAKGEAEYVELYNASGAAVELSDYHIVRWTGDSLGRHYPLPPLRVGPGEYAVLTKDAASVSTCFAVVHPAMLVECALPTYPNDGGAVVLCTADGEVADRLDYSPSMHSPLLRNRAGVALERRSFDRPTAASGNWFSAASTAGYGTPTAPNSQSTERLAEEVCFSLSADILSPDGDGYQDLLTVSYALPDPTLAASAEVYDARGMRIARLLNGDLLGSAGQFDWDGRDEAGNTCRTGRYLIRITLYNTDGLRQEVRRTVALIGR